VIPFLKILCLRFSIELVLKLRNSHCNNYGSEHSRFGMLSATTAP
jgi:hypothetical protein